MYTATMREGRETFHSPIEASSLKEAIEKAKNAAAMFNATVLSIHFISKPYVTEETAMLYRSDLIFDEGYTSAKLVSRKDGYAISCIKKF